MSTERIDHAAEARTVLKLASRDVSENTALQTGEYKADMIATAQVHATLALVEQQRIANLIAYGREKREDLTWLGNRADTLDWLHDGGGVAGYLSKGDRAALGVEDDE